MTRNTNARIAGVAYILYIAAAFPSMVLMRGATSGETVQTQLANMAQHAGTVRFALLLTMVGNFCALALAVSLWAITRDEDPHIAAGGLVCRVAEGVSGAVGIPFTMALLAAVSATGTQAVDPAALQGPAALEFHGSAAAPSLFFAVGSTLFCFLLLRGRMIPLWLAWLGLASSVLCVVGLALQMLRLLGSPFTDLMWIPMAVFELTVAGWFLAKGVAPPRRSTA